MPGFLLWGCLAGFHGNYQLRCLLYSVWVHNSGSWFHHDYVEVAITSSPSVFYGSLVREFSVVCFLLVISLYGGGGGGGGGLWVLATVG